MNSINIKIPSIVENIRMVESFIDNAKEKHPFSEDMYGNIMISVTEAVNNAIKHGNKEDQHKNVNLTIEIHDDLIKFIVEDEGEGFDYDNLPDPTAIENLEKVNGRGIFLIKNLCDHYNFLENGKVLELIFYIQ